MKVAKLKEFLQNAQEIGVDGLIVADLELSTTKPANALFELGAK